MEIASVFNPKLMICVRNGAFSGMILKTRVQEGSVVSSDNVCKVKFQLSHKKTFPFPRAAKGRGQGMGSLF